MSVDSKQLTPLEALKNIEKEVEDFEGFDENTYYQMDRTRFIIIETSLKKLEKWESLKVSEEEAQWLMILVSNPESQLNKLKAFEIIKNKYIDVGWLVRSENLTQYNDCISNKDKHLTQEEYDLLKEVLL